MSFDPKYKSQHRAFRTFLRLSKCLSKSYINNLMIALEIYLPEIIKSNVDGLFSIIYSDMYDIQYLLNVKTKFESHEEWVAEKYGYISLMALQYYIEHYANSHNIDIAHFVTEANSNSDTIDYREGETHQSRITRYERDPRLRSDCIAHYGCKCYVFGFDFEETYGVAGRGYIEVHHIKPLSSIGECHDISIDEVVPLCSNCHSVIHRKVNGLREPYTIEELKKMLQNTAS